MEGVVEWKPPSPLSFQEDVLKKVKLLKPLGIHNTGDVIIVQNFVANFWVQRRMVEETKEPETRSKQVESANIHHNIKGR